MNTSPPSLHHSLHISSFASQRLEGLLQSLHVPTSRFPHHPLISGDTAHRKPDLTNPSRMSPTTQDRKGSSTHGTKHSSKGALLISPLPLSSLTDTTCPICHETYVEPPAPNQKGSSDQEFAVSIDMAAEWHGSKRLCGHVLGRICFEKHLRSKEAWRNRCPLCRDVWFRGDEAKGEDDDEENAQEDELSVPEQAPTAPRRSARIAARTNAGRNTSLLPMSASSGVNRGRNGQRRTSRPRHFTQQLLATLEVRANRDEVTGTMDDVERRLDMLYRDMER